MDKLAHPTTDELTETTVAATSETVTSVPVVKAKLIRATPFKKVAAKKNALTKKSTLAQRHKSSATKKSAGKQKSSPSWQVAVVVTATLVALLGVIGSFILLNKTKDLDADSRERDRYTSFARQVALNLFDVSPENADKAAENFSKLASGKFLQEGLPALQQSIEQIKQSKVATHVEINGVAVQATPQPGVGITSVLVSFLWHATDGALQPISNRWVIDIQEINGELKAIEARWLVK